MSAVPPYHSSKYPGIYHVRDECPLGKRVEEQAWARGSGGGRLCEHCDRLRRERKGK